MPTEGRETRWDTTLRQGTQLLARVLAFCPAPIGPRQWVLTGQILARFSNPASDSGLSHFPVRYLYCRKAAKRDGTRRYAKGPNCWLACWLFARPQSVHV